MCIIVDANLAALVFSEPPTEDFRPVIEWLTFPNKDGRLVIGGHLAVELNKVNAVRRLVRSLYQAGRAQIIPDGAVEDEIHKIRNTCTSNDPHVIALARISGARILCSRDTTLHQDFTNQKLIFDPRGHIYQNAGHEHLLRLYGHTSACKRVPHREQVE